MSYWEETLGVWMKKIAGKDYCAICDYPLDKNRFPEDYPKEWMFCCGCKGIADLITDGILKSRDLRDGIYDKILDKITLVGK